MKRTPAEIAESTGSFYLRNNQLVRRHAIRCPQDAKSYYEFIECDAIERRSTMAVDADGIVTVLVTDAQSAKDARRWEILHKNKPQRIINE